MANGIGRVGWRTLVSNITPSTLWNSIYSVYNADSVGSSSLKTSLYSAYNGESNANDSFGTNHGTAQGGLTYDVGKVGTAFKFNGTNAYVSLPNNSLSLTGDFTVSLWVNLSSLTGHQFFISNVVNQSSLYRGFAIVKNNTTNLINVQFYNSNSSVDVFSSSAMVANTWYNIVLTRKSGVSTKLYVNGVLSGNNTSAMEPNYYPSQACQIGGYNNTMSPSTYFTNGKIDALNIWQKELTQSEITELYNSGNGSQYITDNFYKQTTNDALNTYNGTPQGGLTYDVGKVGTAFKFNGSNAYVSLPNNSLNFTGDFSFSLWMNRKAAVNSYIFSNFYNGSTPYGYYLYISNGTIRFLLGNGTSSPLCNISTALLGGNVWQLITITKTNNSVKMYVDGTLKNSATINGNVVYTTTHYPIIGASKYDSGSPVGFLENGCQIDAVNFWQKELTASEVSELYNSGNGKQYPN